MLSLPSSWFCHTAQYFNIILVSLHACSACYQGWSSQLHSHRHFQHALHHCLIVSLLQICCQYSLHCLSSSFTLTKSHWRYFIIIMAIYYYYYIIILYLSAHVQRTKQALGIAPHEALFKKKKHTQKSLLRHYKKLLTVTQISSSTSFSSPSPLLFPCTRHPRSLPTSHHHLLLQIPPLSGCP